MPKSKRHRRHIPLIREEFTLPNASLYGGAQLYLDYLRKSRIEEAFEEELTLKKATQSTYPLPQMLIFMIEAYTFGLDRIYHFQGVEKDPLLTLKQGFEKLPDHTIYYKDLRNFQGEEDILPLKRINRRLFFDSLKREKSIVLDFDSTVETLYGEQEGAEVGHNPHRHGRPSYHPILACERKSGYAINGQLRGGKAHTAEGLQEFLQETLSLLPEGIEEIFFCGDKGFGSEPAMSILESNLRVNGYVVKLSEHASRIIALNSFKFHLLEGEEKKIEVASGFYQFPTWKKSRRVVVIRKELLDEEDLQGKLFPLPAYEYEIFATDLNWQEEDIWHFYNQRGNDENFIKELKHGFFIDHIPTEVFYANYADMMIKIVAYNFFQNFKKKVLKGAWVRYTIATLRRLLLVLPGVLIHHARQWILKLSQAYPYQEVWWRARSRCPIVIPLRC